ncbi:MAG: TolC family protein [Sphingomonadales bacterium]|nr:TolC family protein [Sphingomonadales bacterium]
MKRPLLYIAIAFSFCKAAVGQPLLTVEEAIATALEKNFEIRLAKNDSAAAALDFQYRNAALLPRLSINSGLVLNNNDQYQKFTDGAVRQRKGIRSENLNAGVALNWTLFNGGRLYATRDRLTALLEAGTLSIKNNIINTIGQVITGYYAIVQQKQQLRALEEQLAINTERVKLAEYKLSIGSGTKPDVLQSKVDLNATKAAQLQQQNSIVLLKEQLNMLMGVASGRRYEVSDSIPFSDRVLLQDIQQGIATTNPVLLMTNKQVDIARLQVREAKAERWPQLNLTSNYNFNRLDNIAVVNPFQPLFSRNSGLNIGFSTAIPLFNQFTAQRNIRSAQLTLQNRQLVYEQQQAQLNLQLVQAYNEYEAQQKALSLEEENIVLAKENVAIVLDVYRLNATTLIQLKEAQKSLQDAYTRLIQARFLTKRAETELLRIKGSLLR